ncbi:DsbA family protein [Filobacillus milosensis]|uniref:DsbA family protein n=1 Tax=Filobacillus milosensis TaxID=94137 RepID=A0A4Y8IEQ5_9BACI|nr:DsbA family protein [Filobacillus milosensis]TFB13297.1 DsbA family protein [Filobacillus milosensis]
MKSKGSPFKIAVIITLVVVILLTVLVIMNKNQSKDEQEMSFGETPSIEGQPIIGDPDAPVTVVEFGDFKCPACKAWGETIFPQLVNDYVEAGKAKFSFINVLFHGEESKLASLASESVYKQSPSAYWEFNKALFDEQPSANHDSQWVTTEKIIEIASDINSIDIDKLKTSIENNSEINEVKKDTELVNKFDVQLTPTIMVNNIMIEDPFDYEEIKLAIDQALEEANL